MKLPSLLGLMSKTLKYLPSSVVLGGNQSSYCGRQGLCWSLTALPWLTLPQPHRAPCSHPSAFALAFPSAYITMELPPSLPSVAAHMSPYQKCLPWPSYKTIVPLLSILLSLPYFPSPIRFISTWLLKKFIYHILMSVPKGEWFFFGSWHISST